MEGLTLNNEYYKLLEDKERLQAWLVYSKWTKFQKVNILNKNGKVIKIKARFENYLIPHIKTYFRYFIIVEHSSKFFEDFFPQKSKENLEERNIRGIAKYIQNMDSVSGVIDFGSRGSCEEDKQNTEDVLLLLEENTGFENLIRKEAFLGSARSIGGADSNESGTMGMRNFMTHRNQISMMNPADAQRYDKRNRTLVKDKMKRALGFERKYSENSDRGSVAYDNEVFNIFKKRDVPSPKKRDIKKLKVHLITPPSSNNSSVMRRIKFNKIENLIHRHLDPYSQKCGYMFTSVLALLMFAVNFIAVGVRGPINDLTHDDIKHRAILVDTISWVVYSQYTVMMTMDVCRAAEEGWLREDLLNTIIDLEGEWEDIRAKCQSDLWLAEYFYLADRDVDVQFRNLSLGVLFDNERFVHSMMKLWIPIENPTRKPDEPWEFEQQVMPRKAAFQYIEMLSKKIHDRDYEHGEGLIDFKGDRKNRLTDVVEETMRRNMMGNFTEEYAEIRWEYYKYMKVVGELNEYTIMLSTLISMVYGFLTVLVFMCWFINKTRKVKRFYRKLFAVKVTNE